VTATPAPPVPPPYSERLWPGPLGWTAVAIFGVFSTISLFPVNATIAVVVGTLVLVAGVIVALLTAPHVTVLGGELRAGQAHIPLELLGAVRTLDADETRLELGPALDARAHLCLRAGARTAVRVEVVDDADPTPYWLISTRHPRELARSVTQERERSVGRHE